MDRQSRHSQTTLKADMQRIRRKLEELDFEIALETVR
jgi:hypothetical protein